MDEPLVIAAIVSLIGLTLTAVITGIFACIKVGNGGNGGCTNGLEVALQAQTQAMSELTTELRVSAQENRGDHKETLRALTVLLERTVKGCEG